MIKNFNKNQATLLPNENSVINSKILSQLCGRFYKDVQFSDFLSGDKNHIYELISGLMNADFWVNLNFCGSALIKIGLEALSLVIYFV